MGRRNSLQDQMEIHPNKNNNNNKHKKLAHSLRLKFKSKSKTINLNELQANHNSGNLSGSLQQDNKNNYNSQRNSITTGSKAFAMQNYVTTQQQQQPVQRLVGRQRPTLFDNALLAATPISHERRPNESSRNSNNYGFVGQTSANNYFTSQPNDYGDERISSSQQVVGVEDKVDEFDGSFSNNNNNNNYAPNNISSLRESNLSQHPFHAPRATGHNKPASNVMVANNSNLANRTTTTASSGVAMPKPSRGSSAYQYPYHHQLQLQQQQQQHPYRYQVRSSLVSSPYCDSPAQLTHHSEIQTNQQQQPYYVVDEQLARRQQTHNYHLQQQQIAAAANENKQQHYFNNNNYQLGAIDFHQASYIDQANNFNQQSYFVPQQPQQQHYKSQTLDVRRKSSLVNPLASLFYNPNAKHSSTIHLGRRDKHGFLASGQSRQESQAKKFSNSLKRVKSSPLSAQQASVEAMRTIDMYLIRQIARSCMVSSTFFPPPFASVFVATIPV